MHIYFCYAYNMKFLKKHGLSIVLISILLFQSIDYFFIGHQQWIKQEKVYAKILGEEAEIGYGDYLNEYRAEMMVSLVADTYGAILLVILTKKLRESGSAESKSQ